MRHIFTLCYNFEKQRTELMFKFSTLFFIFRREVIIIYWNDKKNIINYSLDLSITYLHKLKRL